jgi:hypothetical protein
MRRLAALLLGLAVLTAPAAAQVDPKNALLERSGWDAVATGNARAAAEAFRSAIAADPRNAKLHLGAGMAATLERRDAEARDEFERALELDPKLAQARALLGQIQYRMGERELAVRTYETLVAMTPDDRDASATLARWRRRFRSHDRMQQSINERFTVSLRGPEESTSRRRRCGARRAHWRIGEAPSTYPNRPISVARTPANSSTTLRGHRLGRQPPTMAASACRCGGPDNTTELDRVLGTTRARAGQHAGPAHADVAERGLVGPRPTRSVGARPRRTRARAGVPHRAAIVVRTLTGAGRRSPMHSAPAVR